MFGTRHPRRTELCNELRSRNISVRNETSLFGPNLSAAIRASRLVINTHYYKNASLPVHRINQALSLQTPVVHEHSSDAQLDHDYARWGVLFLDAEKPSSAKQLAEFAAALLRSNTELELARARTLSFARHVAREAADQSSPLCAALRDLCAVNRSTRP